MPLSNQCLVGMAEKHGVDRQLLCPPLEQFEPPLDPVKIPVEQQESLPDGRTLTRFAELPRISTYLVAFTVGPYESTPESATPS